MEGHYVRGIMFRGSRSGIQINNSYDDMAMMFTKQEGQMSLAMDARRGWMY